MSDRATWILSGLFFLFYLFLCVRGYGEGWTALRIAGVAAAVGGLGVSLEQLLKNDPEDEESL